MRRVGYDGQEPFPLLWVHAGVLLWERVPAVALEAAQGRVPEAAAEVLIVLCVICY